MVLALSRRRRCEAVLCAILPLGGVGGWRVARERERERAR
jgi:hypothetical protein